MDKVNESIIDSLVDNEDSGLANPNAKNPEDIKKELDNAVKQKLGSENVDTSKCTTEELLSILNNTSNLSEALTYLKDNLTSYDESVVTKALMDKYGFLDDEATNIYESIKRDSNGVNVCDLYDCLDNACEKGFIPDKYCYDKCFDDEFVPESLEDCCKHCDCCKEEE